MFRYFLKLVRIFFGIDVEPGDEPKYRAPKLPRECDNCPIIPTYLYKFNAAWLCELCYKLQLNKFPSVVAGDERPNAKKAKAKKK
jgi:hypothetical protein